MNPVKVCELYIKERQYQQKIFGDYSKNPNFNVATFLQFIENYLDKAKKAYVSKWTRDRPSWLSNCKEFPATAPIETYEELIKVFALTGAALEALTEINTDQWREGGIKEKWRKDGKE